jgi:hypothetical protein
MELPRTALPCVSDRSVVEYLYSSACGTSARIFWLRGGLDSEDLPAIITAHESSARDRG